MNYVLIIAILTITACGALPHNKSSDTLAPINRQSRMSGIVITSTKAQVSSTLHFYDFRTGKISLLLGSESSDVLTAWLGKELYVFNREPGRVSYSRVVPSRGAVSRSHEQATPGESRFDPSAAALTRQGQLVLSMNAKGRLLVIDPNTNRTEATLGLSETNLSGQTFRPAGLYVERSDDHETVWVAHQGLDEGFNPVGTGYVLGALLKDEGGWSWISPSPIPLTVTNPVFVQPRGDGSLLVAGTCYKPSCKQGVDLVNLQERTTRMLSEWANGEWNANGDFFADLSDETLLVSATYQGRNVLARYEINTGKMSVVRNLIGAWCSGVVADRDQQQLFIGEPTADGRGLVTIIDRDNKASAAFLFDQPVSGLTAVYED